MMRAASSSVRKSIGASTTPIGGSLMSCSNRHASTRRRPRHHVRLRRRRRPLMDRRREKAAPAAAQQAASITIGGFTRVGLAGAEAQVLAQAEEAVAEMLSFGSMTMSRAGAKGNGLAAGLRSRVSAGTRVRSRGGSSSVDRSKSTRPVMAALPARRSFRIGPDGVRGIRNACANRPASRVPSKGTHGVGLRP